MGYNLKKAREAAGLTQEELAEKSGVKRGTISNIETGKQTDMMVGNLKRIAEALGCEISDLVD